MSKCDQYVDIKKVAKLMTEVFDDCPCNFDDIAEYMNEHFSDECSKYCGLWGAEADYTICWEKFLLTKLEEMKRGQK